MTVYAFQFYGFTVQKINASAYFGGADTHFFTDNFVLVSNGHIVKVRIFRAPQNRVLNLESNGFTRAYLLFLAQKAYNCLGSVKQCESNGSVKGGLDSVIHNVTRGARQKIDVAENTRKAQFVLVLEIGAHAPLKHQNVQLVFAVGKIIRHVELRLTVRNLRKSDETVVDVKIEAGIHPFEIKVILLIGFFKVEFFAIMICRVLIGDVRRIVRERIVDVGILKMVVAVVLHAAGNVDFRIHFFKIEVVFYVKNAFVILNLPLAVKVGKPAALLPVGKSVLARLERYVIRARIQYAHKAALFIILFKHFPYSFLSELFIL